MKQPETIEELCERRGKEIRRAIDEVIRLERLVELLGERADESEYWQARCRRAESENAGLRLELARLEFQGAT